MTCAHQASSNRAGQGRVTLCEACAGVVWLPACPSLALASFHPGLGIAPDSVLAVASSRLNVPAAAGIAADLFLTNPVLEHVIVVPGEMLSC